MDNPKSSERVLGLSNIAFWAFASAAILVGIDMLFLDSHALAWLRSEVGAPLLVGADLHRREAYVLGTTGSAALFFHFISLSIAEGQKKK